MPSIEQLVRQNINPFDSTTFRPGNFWKESQDENQEVTSIHKGVLDSVEQTLELLLRDRKTRTLMLVGDTGSGKSYLLGRLKRRLNDKACFAYVTPWPDSKFIWRHVLRQTVDSLLETPEGQSESQLLRWLNGLEVLKRQGLAKRIRGERSVFVSDMRASFPSGLYRPRDFFGVLYALLDESTRMTASDW
ncbi:MAG: ATP-binding protein, partial [Phormidesmis sp.]